jgi:hypothetical protein
MDGPRCGSNYIVVQRVAFSAMAAQKEQATKLAGLPSYARNGPRPTGPTGCGVNEPSAAQTGNAVAVDVALPGQELIDRDVVKSQASSIGIQPPRTAWITAALRRTVQRWLAFGSSGTAPSASSQSGSFAPLSPGCGGNSSTVAVGISLTLYRCSQIPIPAMTAMKTAAVPAVRTSAIPSDVKPSISR